MDLDDSVFPRDDSSKDQFYDDWNPNPTSETDTRSKPAEGLDPFEALTRGSGALNETAARSLSRVDLPKAVFIPSDPLRYRLPGVPSNAVANGETAANEPIDRPLVFPKLGEGIGGFRLISELGRGAFARVYLAHEVELGNRPVALKVSKAEGDEPRILARLQHTNIVPIHSVYDDRSKGLRLICMPYFGGANLAQVLDAAGPRSAHQTQGQSFVNALDLIGLPVIASQPIRPARQPRRSLADSLKAEGSVVTDAVAAPLNSLTFHRSLLGRLTWWPRARSVVDVGAEGSPVEADPSQPARQFLLGSSYVRASVWIMARLAEGLEHAHSRGLLHRDLKPSNILIAADGTPMLLDFNLATETYLAGPEDGTKAMMGGTLPYMSPEHLDAFNPQGATSPDSVDERSDLYALGLILFEMIARQPVFPAPPSGMKLFELLAFMTNERRRGAPSLRETNPEVPWSLAAIVAKCLDPNPDLRFQSAGAFAEELRRFLDDQPLKFTREPSGRESLAKWSRRHPRASSASTIVPCAIAILLGIGAVAWTQAAYLRQVSARLNLRRFHETFNECQFLLNTSSGSDLAGHLRLGIEKAQSLIDRHGVAHGGDWDRGYWAASLTPEERTGLRTDLAELILLEARARVMVAEKEGKDEDRRRALEWAVVWLDRAEVFDPVPSPALFADRARYQRALGRADLFHLDDERSKSLASTSCRDEYLLGTSELAAGRFDRAEQRLNRAVSLEPSRFWAWFALGLCHFDQGRYGEAVGDFNVCTVLMPQFAWSFVNRGLAQARSGRLTEACESFDRAVGLNPSFADALGGRGLARLELGQAGLAERDLSRAIELGMHDPRVRAGRAEAIAKLGRRDEALALFADLIAERPSDTRLLVERGMIRLKTDPRAAGADFRAAITLDPDLALAHYGLACIDYRSDPTSAQKHVDRALAIEPCHLDSVELRALIRARLGRGDSSEDVDVLIKAPTPNRLFNAACAMAILAKNKPDLRHETRAIDLLRRAIETGFPPKTAREDPDLKSLQLREDFRRLVGLEPSPL